MKTLVLLLICTIALCNTNLDSNTTEISPVEETAPVSSLSEETAPALATPSAESDSSDDSSESSSDSSSDSSDSSDSEFESSERPHGRRFPGRHHRRPHPQWHRRPHPRGPEGSEEFERRDFEESSEGGDRHWRPHPRGHGRPDWHRRPHPREDGAPEPQFNGEELFEAPRGDFDGERHWRPHHGHRRPHWHKRHHRRGSEEAGRPTSEDSSDFVNLNDTEIEGPSDVDRQWRRPHHGHRRPHWGRRPHPRDEAPEAQSNGEQSFQAPTQEGEEFRPRPHWNKRHPRDHHRRQQESQESEGSIPEQIAQPEVVAEQIAQTEVVAF